MPVLLLPNIPLNIETFLIILPYSAAVAVVGLLETLMTAAIVDELTDTPSNKNRECIGQGIANTITGFWGHGRLRDDRPVDDQCEIRGRGRLSSLCAGVFLLFMILVLGQWVRQIPMAALVAIMIMVSIGTFSWSSIRNLKDHPRSSSFVMIATVIGVVATHNLAVGVLVGVLLSAVFFAWKIAQIFQITSILSPDGKTRTYKVEGQIFFASVEDFNQAFEFKEALENVIIDVSRAHIWDISSVAALDMIVLKFRREGAEVSILGLNRASETIVDKLAIHDKPGAMERLMGH